MNCAEGDSIMTWAQLLFPHGIALSSSSAWLSCAIIEECEKDSAEGR